MDQNNSLNSEKHYTLGFALMPNIGPVRFEKIINFFKSPEIAWKATIADYEAKGLSSDIIKIINEHKSKIDIEKEWEKLKVKKINFITQNDISYPNILKQIHNPPFGLFVRGIIPEFEIAIAVVGTREPTPYGSNIAKKITEAIALHKILVVSGLAMGIDTIAHQTVLENDSQTIAVLGGGIDDASLYPQVNRKLAEKIIESGGAVISEYPPNAPSLAHQFPVRNRIISGLAQAIIVVEGELDSGSLITAKFALEQNKEILAVPGNITNSKASGPNALIKQGAHPILSPDDIFEVLNIAQITKQTKAKKLMPSSPEEREIIGVLTDIPMHLDDVINNTGLDIKKINSTLTIMEMKGMIRNIGAGMYVKE